MFVVLTLAGLVHLSFNALRHDPQILAVGECPLAEHALDREVAARLWEISEEKTGLNWSP